MRKVVLMVILAGALLAIISVRAQKLNQSTAAVTEAALIDSARTGNETAVRQLLNSGLSPNTRDSRDKENSTVLMVAAMAGQTAIIRILTAAGADAFPVA